MVVGVRTKIRSDRFPKIYGENHATCGLAISMDNVAFTLECEDRIVSTVLFFSEALRCHMPALRILQLGMKAFMVIQ